jgi:hypothetical protein
VQLTAAFSDRKILLTGYLKVIIIDMHPLGKVIEDQLMQVFLRDCVGIILVVAVRLVNLGNIFEVNI